MQKKKKVIKIRRAHANFIDADPNKEKAVYAIPVQKGKGIPSYICPECKKIVENTDSYCRHCGYKLSFESPVKQKKAEMDIMDFSAPTKVYPESMPKTKSVETPIVQPKEKMPVAPKDDAKKETKDASIDSGRYFQSLRKKETKTDGKK